MTKAQAKAAAHRINLTTADLPDFRTQPGNSGTGGIDDARMAKCAGGVPPGKDLASVDSPWFVKGAGLQQLQVVSSVTVMPSAALVQKDLAAIRSQRGQRCLNHAMTQSFRGQSAGQVTVAAVKITRLTPPSSGTDGAFGYRLLITLRAGQTRIPFFADALGFAHGPLEISLTTFGIGQPFPSDQQQKLYGLLVSRAAGAAS